MMKAGANSQVVSFSVNPLGDGLSPWLGWVAAMVVLVFVGVVLAAVYARRRRPVEDPARLTDYFKALQTLTWAKEDTASSLDQLATATTTLFQAEVTYYYRTRTARRRTASLFRWSAFLFGTAGLACPLLETAVPTWTGVSRLGYILLAAAAASLAGNELFGGTKGHIRTVTAQYTLERLLNAFVVDWSEWRSTVEQTGDFSGGFTILRRLSNGVYSTLLDETKEWGTVLSEAEGAYRVSVSPNTSRSETSAR
ncbi:SLATT domain-containing protein [Sphingomonas sp. CFBP 8760]|uniref:SLATT domain-containing protein n=1 Tax=Sphingomonas sp. CFBP 8760 TaxID=2775282 RepID=UPI0017855E24|nr:SLATT domain-containing protein [Sphingomonas sp. CFBP 8760]MBD8546844.1 SLATT domain-containing protein [Sphingomonas sp. CFBP 8760]